MKKPYMRKIIVSSGNDCVCVLKARFPPAPSPNPPIGRRTNPLLI